MEGFKDPEYYVGKYDQIKARNIVADFQHNNYNLGTALTYIIRAGKKPDNPAEKDIQKAIDHLNFELDRIKKEKA